MAGLITRWSAGYNASKYDRLYTELFEGKDPWKVYHLLKENGISYVAYDNAVRQASVHQATE